MIPFFGLSCLSPQRWPLFIVFLIMSTFLFNMNDQQEQTPEKIRMSGGAAATMRGLDAAGKSMVRFFEEYPQ